MVLDRPSRNYPLRQTTEPLRSIFLKHRVTLQVHQNHEDRKTRPPDQTCQGCQRQKENGFDLE